MKLVKLSDLFDCAYGTDLAQSHMTPSDRTNGIPFVSRKKLNNGVAGYVVKDHKYTPNPAGTISVALGGSVLSAFFHSCEYYSGRDLAVLTPKIKMTEPQILYYCECINSNAFKYSFGRQANTTYKDILIPDISALPSWVSHDTIAECTNTIRKLEAPSGIPVDTSGWKRFQLITTPKAEGLFKVITGETTTIQHAKKYRGHTPVVSGSGKNNGIACYTGIKGAYKNGYLTLTTNGTIGELFYQPMDFCITIDAVVLASNNIEITPEVVNALAVIVKTETDYQFSYGRKLKNYLEQISIRLPIDGVGNPDWKMLHQLGCVNGR